MKKLLVTVAVLGLVVGGCAKTEKTERAEYSPNESRSGVTTEQYDTQMPATNSGSMSTVPGSTSPMDNIGTTTLGAESTGIINASPDSVSTTNVNSVNAPVTNP